LRVSSVWGELPAPNRRWLIVNALLVTVAINVVVNAVIAWLGVKGQAAVTMWGVPLAETSIFWNVVGTLFLLPLITCVLTTTAIRRDMRRGTLVPLEQLRSTRSWLAALPLSRWRRGLLLGVLIAAALAPPLVLVLLILGVTDFDKGQFVACQTAFAVALGALVTPPIALFAMADPPSLRHDPAP
jgi:hypothetical protein